MTMTPVKAPSTLANNPDWWKGQRRDNESLRQRATERNIRQQLLAQQAMVPFQAINGALGDVQDAPMACLPASIPATKLVRGPMTEAQFDEDFGPEFALIGEDTRSVGLVSKLTTGGSPLAPFFMRGACIVGRVDPFAYALTGGAVPPPAAGAAPPRVPRVVPTTGTAETPTMQPAVFEYNHSALQAFMNLLQAYQFQYVLQNRFIMINERAIDVGVLDSHWHYKGFGTGQADPMPGINEANKHFIDVGNPSIFFPSNVSAYAVDGSALEPAIVDIQYATPCAPGVFGVCMPVRPHVLFPGQFYTFLFTRLNETFFHERLRRDMQATSGLLKPHDNYADTNAGAGAPAIWAGHIPFRYGVMQIGVILRGAELIPEECLMWLLMYGQPYYQLLTTNRQAWEYVDSIARGCGLAGVPRPLANPQIDKRWGNTQALETLFTARKTSTGLLAGYEVNNVGATLQDKRQALIALCGNEIADPKDFRPTA